MTFDQSIYTKGSKTWYTGKVIAGGTFILHRMPPTIFGKRIRYDEKGEWGVKFPHLFPSMVAKLGSK